SSRGPGIPPSDRVAVLVNQQRAIEMRSGINWTVAIVLDAAAPENDASLVIGRLQRKPAVEGVNRSAREEVAKFHRAQYDVNTHGVTGANCRVHTIQRSSHWLRRRARSLRGRR